MIDKWIRAKFKARSSKMAFVPADDPYEENDTTATAATMIAGTYQNLVCEDDDWCILNISNDRDLVVTINFKKDILICKYMISLCIAPK